MTTDIFIKTYAKDLQWLELCLRSINKFCTGFRDVVIVAPEGDKKLVKEMGLTVEKVKYVDEGYVEGYVAQQIVKIHADEYTDADYILFVDSDCIFLKPTKPGDFFSNSFPYLLYTDYSKVDTPWQSGTEFVLKRPVKFEFMRRHPMMYHRDTLKAFRNFIQETHGMSTKDFMAKHQQDVSLSEFNMLGAFAYYFSPGVFTWINTEVDEVPERCMHQFWSYAGVNGKVRAEARKMMGE